MHVHTIIVTLKNGSPDRSEDPSPVQPPALLRCEQLWKARGRRRSWPKDHWTFVRSAIEPLLYARIEPEDVHYDNGLMNRGRAIDAQAIELSSVSFENGPIPTISAFAQVQMTFDRAFADTIAFYDWQAQTDWLDWGVSFGFRFKDGGEWDATWENGGIDFELLES